MFKRFLLSLGALLLVLTLLGAGKALQIKQLMAMNHEQPPKSVTTMVAATAEWHTSLNAIGTLAPMEGVTISADADGTIVRIAAESGSAVKEGDLLVELDVSVETAQLAAAAARAELARINLERARELWDRKAMAKSEFDLADATQKQAVAEVAALNALIDKKRVRAPFAGRVGIRQVNTGQFVARGRALIPLQKLDPIYVNFNVPQRQLPSLSLGQSVEVAIDAFNGRTFTGAITAIDSEVDPTTRNVSVQATLANPQEELRAGMFARVEVRLPDAVARIVLPATAISYASYGNSVFIIEKMKDKAGKEYLGVREQPVKVAQTQGDLVAILDGVKPGEVVATSGVFKLRNGAAIQVNNVIQPASSSTPKPDNT